MTSPTMALPTLRAMSWFCSLMMRKASAAMARSTPAAILMIRKILFPICAVPCSASLT
ncbi:hypothetical protein [Maribacter cobaltidurans]|uniref:hypothetical protein n=1 Tax=Maribacter cobaltidurans TaxID=1178778 RepID=UPI0013154449|nr:hypothetical protein [Maribacter cobaltidurans]